MNAMTPRQIVLANLHHQPAPRPGMTFDNGRLNDFLFGGFGPTGYTQKRWTEDKFEYYDDSWGNIWVRMKDGCFKGEIHQPVLPSWDDLPDLRLPAYDVDACVEALRTQFADNPEGKFRVASMGGWVFNDARYLRKLEIYLMDMGLYPDELHALHEKVGSVYETKIHIAGRSGADAIMFGEDLGTQTGPLFSPAMFREYFKPLYSRLMDLAHEYGMKVLMHSCGQNRMLLDDLIDCGVDCFQFDQPMVYDPDELAALFHARGVALWSPVDIQKVLPTGDRELIERESRRMAEIFRGCLIAKNYPDLNGIGVEREWDQWAYEAIVATFSATV